MSFDLNAINADDIASSTSINSSDSHSNPYNQQSRSLSPPELFKPPLYPAPLPPNIRILNPNNQTTQPTNDPNHQAAPILIKNIYAINNQGQFHLYREKPSLKSNSIPSQQQNSKNRIPAPSPLFTPPSYDAPLPPSQTHKSHLTPLQAKKITSYPTLPSPVSIQYPPDVIRNQENSDLSIEEIQKKFINDLIQSAAEEWTIEKILDNIVPPDQVVIPENLPCLNLSSFLSFARPDTGNALFAIHVGKEKTTVFRVTKVMQHGNQLIIRPNCKYIKVDIAPELLLPFSYSPTFLEA